MGERVQYELNQWSSNHRVSASIAQVRSAAPRIITIPVLSSWALGLRKRKIGVPGRSYRGRRDEAMKVPLDWLMYPLHRWIWRDAHRRARKLFRFGETEADGGRDLARASELTSDPRLRGLYLRHAQDEQRHADMFRQQASAVFVTLGSQRRTYLRGQLARSR